jgi:hypothetical protein
MDAIDVINVRPLLGSSSGGSVQEFITFKDAKRFFTTIDVGAIGGKLLVYHFLIQGKY